MAKKAYAKFIPTEVAQVTDPGLVDKPMGATKEAIIKRRATLSIADQVAGNSYHYKNFYYPGGAESFPHEIDMRMVDKYYPNAVGGPLLIDEPMLPDDVRKCEVKAKALKEKGFRYLVIRRESTLEECMVLAGLGD